MTNLLGVPSYSCHALIVNENNASDDTALCEHLPNFDTLRLFDRNSIQRKCCDFPQFQVPCSQAEAEEKHGGYFQRGCGPDEYEAVPCTPLTDRVCKPISPKCCPDGPDECKFYTATPATLTNDRVCARCTKVCAKESAYIPSDPNFMCSNDRDAICTACQLDDQDIVFLVDAQYSMSDKLASVNEFIREVIGNSATSRAETRYVLTCRRLHGRTLSRASFSIVCARARVCVGV